MRASKNKKNKRQHIEYSLLMMGKNRYLDKRIFQAL